MAQNAENGGLVKKNMTKVLVVDDDEGLAGLVKKMIEKMGIYSVKTAVNAEKGYEIFLYFKR